jgi:hypothetical protein
VFQENILEVTCRNVALTKGCIMKNTLSKINELLVKEDIEGLIDAGAPSDEYEDEAAQILATILLLDKDQQKSENVLAVVSLIWMKSFGLSGEDMRLRKQAIERIVQQIVHP